jgi:hypothetical protein
MTIDVALLDSATHQLSVYFVDWDRRGRSATIQVLNAATSAVLDTRQLTAFGGGQYLRWSISGQVRVHVINNSGSVNGVYSGVFLD